MPLSYSQQTVAVNLFLSFLVFLFFCLFLPYSSFFLCFYKSQSLKTAHQLRCAAPVCTGVPHLMFACSRTSRREGVFHLVVPNVFIFRIFLNLGFAKTMFCNLVAFTKISSCVLGFFARGFSRKCLHWRGNF